MQTLINSFSFAKKEEQALLFSLLQAPLANIPFHTNTEAVTRYIAANFPVHLAVHEVSPVFTPPAEYTFPHIHNDCDEINILLSTNKLLYKIQLGNDEYLVKSNSAIWIPKGMVHAANVINGSGYFITLRLQG